MAHKRRVSWRTLYAIETLIGTVLTACVALLISAFFYTSALKFIIPLLFVVVVVLMAYKFGALTGVLGSVAAALIFAAFLFAPFGSIALIGERARESLNWMLLGGISLSFLFSRRTMELQREYRRR